MLLLAAGTAVFVYLTSRIGIAVIAAMLRRVGWGFLIVAALYALHISVRALALWATLMQLPGARLPFADVLRVRLNDMRGYYR